MLAVIGSHGVGATKTELTEALRREETARGLVFDYCLITAGSSHNRAPSDQRWEKGEPLSVDSGGNYHGYIGDLAHMGIAGEPDAELEDLLAEIEATQQAANRSVLASTA
jgi:Xaa-Pro dipeptidase